MKNTVYLFRSNNKTIAVIISDDLRNEYTPFQSLDLMKLYPVLLNRFMRDEDDYNLIEVIEVSKINSREYFMKLKKYTYCIVNIFALWKHLTLEEKAMIFAIKND